MGFKPNVTIRHLFFSLRSSMLNVLENLFASILTVFELFLFLFSVVASAVFESLSMFILCLASSISNNKHSLSCLFSLVSQPKILLHAVVELNPSECIFHLHIPHTSVVLKINKLTFAGALILN